MITREGPWLAKGDVLAVLGDSITHNPDSYMGALVPELEKRGVTVHNAGVSGDKTVNALARLKTDVLDRSPTAVSVFLGTNDSAVGRGRWGDEPRISPDAYGTNLRWIIHLCRQKGIGKFSITPPMFRFEGPAFADTFDTMRDYCLAAREAADDMDARLVPLDAAAAEAWREAPGAAGLLLTRDGVHPNETGRDLIVRTHLSAWGM